MTEPSATMPLLSVVIPNRNGRSTLEPCLDALASLADQRVEVVVADDGSSDGSYSIIRLKPVRLVELPPTGASAARNAGARAASADVLFFIDADCVVGPDTLETALREAQTLDDSTIIGGTYTPRSHDGGFFSDFQSVFINYSETKYEEPDYVATHAMLIRKDLFERLGGFNENFMPILEDVDFSHRARAQGVRLLMRPCLTVSHIFNFDLKRSLKNAVRKSMHWTRYSLLNKDVASDSGTASIELKANVALWGITMLCLLWLMFSENSGPLLMAMVLQWLNMYISRGLVRAFMAQGHSFAAKAIGYYALVYPGAVALGAVRGIMKGIP